MRRAEIYTVWISPRMSVIRRVLKLGSFLICINLIPNWSVNISLKERQLDNPLIHWNCLLMLMDCHFYPISRQVKLFNASFLVTSQTIIKLIPGTVTIFLKSFTIPIWLYSIFSTSSYKVLSHNKSMSQIDSFSSY